MRSLDEVAGLADLVSSGLPPGVGPPCPSLLPAPPCPGQEGGCAQNAAVGFQVGQDAAYGAFAYLAVLNLAIVNLAITIRTALLPRLLPQS